MTLNKLVGIRLSGRCSNDFAMNATSFFVGGSVGAIGRLQPRARERTRGQNGERKLAS